MSVRLLLTSGRGPAECRIALSRLLEVLRGEAEALGLSLDVAEGPAPDRHGPGSAVAVVAGEGAEAFARCWIGSVLWVCASPVRPHHRRKNWYVGVGELPARDVGGGGVSAAEVRFETFRAGGAGG